MALVKKGAISEEELYNIPNPFVDDIEKLKYSTRKNVKRYGYLSLFAILRVYIHTANYLKKKSIELAKKIESKLVQSKTEGTNEEHKEANRHLKMVSEYLTKIRRMKKKIKEEEGLE
ncbi:MAG TPA: hypothetical protein VFQ59_00780 [Candidatus Paceibacterota bacterium]|nr:hypothetical protein [Candidatus Paceibacterota bacterium]